MFFQLRLTPMTCHHPYFLVLATGKMYSNIVVVMERWGSNFHPGRNLVWYFFSTCAHSQLNYNECTELWLYFMIQWCSTVYQYYFMFVFAAKGQNTA